MIGETISHFRILREVRQTAFGTDFEASDLRLRRTVLLKVIDPGLAGTEGIRDRFLQDARAAAAIHHPNIARVFEFGKSDGTVFLAMELIEGEDLRSLIDSNQISLDDALRIGIEITQGVEHGHEKGLVHGDLRPENIVIGADGRPRILNFGLGYLHSRTPHDDSFQNSETLSSRIWKLPMQLLTFPLNRSGVKAPIFAPTFFPLV
jgi:serine/threonine-protein kinase